MEKKEKSIVIDKKDFYQIFLISTAVIVALAVIIDSRTMYFTSFKFLTGFLLAFALVIGLGRRNLK